MSPEHLATGSDITAPNGYTVEFKDGQTEQELVIDITDDTIPELNEFIDVTLEGATVAWSPLSDKTPDSLSVSTAVKSIEIAANDDPHGIFVLGCEVVDPVAQVFVEGNIELVPLVAEGSIFACEITRTGGSFGVQAVLWQGR